ncbi:hypothetical protein CYMTET_34345 [Cymbomonas tetramitiformis]|uniref:Sialidase domain-containing protein n=1 Tax=Cymbomonas tetramitiformis TaxID=36881 RepID=A0AAE0FB94_9CHLO|nr:hypothetical protein CYMTET_34345 [Cymbomonas tetramitiformis]
MPTGELLRSDDDTEWLLPMYYTPDGFFEHASQYSTIQRSSDGGATWTEDVMEGTLGKLVQPTVLRLKDRSLLAFFRSRDADWIYKSRSSDDGKTWTEPEKTELPNNNSGIQAAMLKSGAIAIVFNNLQGAHARWPLSIALSFDEGNSWPQVRDLEPMKPAGSPPLKVRTLLRGGKVGHCLIPANVASESGRYDPAGGGAMSLQAGLYA